MIKEKGVLIDISTPLPANFWISIQRARDCLFGRRFGHEGRIVWGYSIRLRLFGKDLI